MKKYRTLHVCFFLFFSFFHAFSWYHTEILLSVVAEWVAVTLHVQVHSRFVTLSHTELQEYFLTLKEQFLTPRPSAPQSLYQSLSLAHFTSRSLPKNLHSKRHAYVY